MSPGHCTDHVCQNPPGFLGRRLCRADSDGVCPHTSWVICTWVPPPCCSLGNAALLQLLFTEAGGRPPPSSLKLTH